MIYFDNAATGGRKPEVVLTAVQSATRICANPGRSGHKLSLSCAKLVQSARNELDSFFLGFGYDRVIFTKNCTEALNIALFGVLKKGDHVVVSCMEHNSVLRPLEWLKKAGVITYDICPLTSDDEKGTISPTAILSRLRKNTKLVAITSASNVNGKIPDIPAIRSVLPNSVLLLCDGAQGAGHFPIPLSDWGVDLFTIAGHKGMFGIQGSGALLFSERVNPEPLFYGGTGSMSLSLDMPDFYPDRLEAGTISFPAVLSLLEGTRFLQENLPQVSARCVALSAYFLQELKKMPTYFPYSTPNPCGIVAFAHQKLQSEQLAEKLSSVYDIAVRGGLHCAPLMHEALGTLDGGLTRVSFSHYNTTHEIDELLTALDALRKG
ncbi:MAG: aminotransferase class V-fold PLP-dependent enzyme [Clostridiales bacterium]|nr:aminotransferase class V-fold PLP-dependent enzyme [Clostridiales bacterium]